MTICKAKPRQKSSQNSTARTERVHPCSRAPLPLAGTGQSGDCGTDLHVHGHEVVAVADARGRRNRRGTARANSAPVAAMTRCGMFAEVEALSIVTVDLDGLLLTNANAICCDIG